MFDLAAALAEGAKAGAEAAGATPGRGRASRALVAASGGTLGVVAPMSDAELSKAFVDFQNDVTARDIRLATREGMRSIEHIKRYTTTGMATDQGKTSNMNALAIAAESLGQADRRGRADDVPPALYARDLRRVRRPRRGANMFDPVRETPLHSWFVAQRRDIRGSGPVEARLARAAARRDRRRRRSSASAWRRAPAAGIMDASTLGKIEVVGPDAAEFLNRLYVNSFAKLGVGRCRYGLMLNEMGFVYDDGVVMRLAEDRFHITTTTSGAAHVQAVMEDYLQTEWPDLKAALHLDHRAIGDDRDQRPAGARNPRAAGRGDRSLERRLPAYERARGAHRRRPDAARARQLHRRTRFRGQRALGLRRSACSRRSGRRARSAAPSPMGSTRCWLLRAEKGFIIVGQDTDGTVTPDDLGMGADGRDVEARFRRQALAGAAGSAATGAEAARRTAQPKTPRSRPTRARRSSPTPSRRSARPRSATSLRPI